MSGLFDQRLRLYRRLDAGTDGSVEAVFVFVAERWGRLDERSSSSRIRHDRVETTHDAVAEFSDETEVPVDGIVVIPATRSGWWVRGVYHARATRRVVVYLDRMADEQFRTLRMSNAASAVGGTHVVNPG